MKVMFGILLMTTGAAVGSLYQDAAVCTFPPDDQNVSCYAALGRRLHLNPPQNLPRNPGFKLNKINKPSDQTILDYKTTKNSTVNVPGWQFIINNYTIIINHTEKSDSATYRLQITDSNGSTRETFLHLNIEAPVSSVTMTENCLSIPKRTVFCTAEGDELQYEWIVESSVPHVLDKEKQTLLLDKDSTGSVTCHVKNHVSSETRTINLQPCPGSLYRDPAVCKFSPSDQSVLCYVALGRRLHLNPPQNLPRNPGFKLKKINKPSDKIILDYKTYSKNSTVNVPGWQFIINNYTIIINHTEKSDSATYRLDITDSNGSTRETFLHLNIEAPVSSVTVTENCLSILKMTVFCTAEGDKLQYEWTIKSSAPHVLDKENQTLWVDKNSNGSVICHVKNQISSGTRNFNLQPCPASILVFVTVWIFQIIVLLSLLVGAFYIYASIYKKRRTTE